VRTMRSVNIACTHISPGPNTSGRKRNCSAGGFFGAAQRRGNQPVAKCRNGMQCAKRFLGWSPCCSKRGEPKRQRSAQSSARCACGRRRVGHAATPGQSVGARAAGVFKDMPAKDEPDYSKYTQCAGLPSRRQWKNLKRLLAWPVRSTRTQNRPTMSSAQR